MSGQEAGSVAEGPGDRVAAGPGVPDFQALFEGVPGNFLVLAPDAPRFTMLAATDERLATTLSTREQTIGRPLFEVFSDANPANPAPSGVTRLRASLETVLRTRAPDRMAVQRYDLRRPDGEWEVRYWAPRNVPVLGPDGAVRYIVHHVEDVTERVLEREATEVAERAAATLAESEARLQRSESAARRALDELEAIYRTAPIGLAVLDRELRFVRINERLAAINGHPVDFHLGRTVREVIPAVADTAEAVLRRVLDTGEPQSDVTLSAVLPGRPGVLRHWLEQWIPLRDATGAVIGVNIVAEEVTERHATETALRASEERFRLMADAVPQIVWITDGEGRTEFFNRQWTTYTGAAFSPTTAAQIATGFVHPDDQGATIAAFEEARRTGGSFRVEHRIRSADGGYRWFLVRAEPYRDAATGAIVRWFGASVDIHDRKQAEAERERLLAAAEAARAEAEAAARTKSEFLATMSHEFRTPLNAIIGYAQLLDMGVLGPATPAQHAHLERLQASARHLLGLIEDVLDVAKVDADRLQVRREAQLTGVAVAAAMTLVQPQATARGVRLMDLGAGEPGVPYLGDEHRVRQVLVNLLSNAVKFTPPGGEVTVACGAAAEPEPGVWTGDATGARAAGAGWAFIRVVDTGPGIAPEFLGRLFEPFVQGDGALTREHGGTGLGLAISRRLARLMGGDLVARSQPGAGATFTLWLPGAPDADAMAERPTAPSEPAARAGTGTRRRTPTSGMRALASPDAPLDGAAYAVLHALGVRLAAEAETVSERYVAALRSDGRFPDAAELPTVQLRDHATPAIGLLAAQLMIIGETRGQAPELLGDGAQVQRLMAELHGAQRHRLGWTEADVEREAALLVAEIERTLRHAVDTASVPGESARAAAQFAATVARHITAQGTATALRAYRFARATAT